MRQLTISSISIAAVVCFISAPTAGFAASAWMKMQTSAQQDFEDGKFAQAEQQFKEAVELARAQKAPRDELLSVAGLANTCFAQAKFKSGVRIADRLLVLLEKLPSVNDRLVITALTHAADTSYYANRFETASAFYKQALVLEERAHWRSKLNRNEQFKVIFEIERLGMCYDRLHKYAHAEQAYRLAIAEYDHWSCGVFDGQTAQLMKPYAVALRQLNRPADADRVEADIRSFQSGALTTAPKLP